jgi:hypothetical protein
MPLGEKRLLQNVIKAAAARRPTLAPLCRPAKPLWLALPLYHSARCRQSLMRYNCGEHKCLSVSQFSMGRRWGRKCYFAESITAANELPYWHSNSILSDEIRTAGGRIHQCGVPRARCPRPSGRREGWRDHGVIDREVATMKKQANEYFFVLTARTLLPLLAL